MLSGARTLDAGVVTHGREAERLHLDVADAALERAAQERHLVFLRIVAEGAVESRLTCDTRHPNIGTGKKRCMCPRAERRDQAER